MRQEGRPAGHDSRLTVDLRIDTLCCWASNPVLCILLDPSTTTGYHYWGLYCLLTFERNRWVYGGRRPHHHSVLTNDRIELMTRDEALTALLDGKVIKVSRTYIGNGDADLYRNFANTLQRKLPSEADNAWSAAISLDFLRGTRYELFTPSVDFWTALKACSEGKKIRRENWNESTYLYFNGLSLKCSTTDTFILYKTDITSQWFINE